jgi:hypothetical protein
LVDRPIQARKPCFSDMTPAFCFSGYPLELPHELPHDIPRGFPLDALLSFHCFRLACFLPIRFNIRLIYVCKLPMSLLKKYHENIGSFR